jgi:hypothetical protein
LTLFTNIATQLLLQKQLSFIKKVSLAFSQILTG